MIIKWLGTEHLFSKSVLLMTALQGNRKLLSVSSSSRMCIIGDALLLPQTTSWVRWAPLGSSLHSAVDHRELPLWLVRRTAGRHQYSDIELSTTNAHDYEIWIWYLKWSYIVVYFFTKSGLVITVSRLSNWTDIKTCRALYPNIAFNYVGNFNA